MHSTCTAEKLTMNFSTSVYGFTITLATPDSSEVHLVAMDHSLLTFWLHPLCLKYEVEIPKSQQLNFIPVIWLQKLVGPSSTAAVGEIGQWKNWVHLPMHCGVCNGRKLRRHQKSLFVRVPIWFQKSYASLNKVKNASVFTSVTIISAVIATGTQCS